MNMSVARDELNGVSERAFELPEHVGARVLITLLRKLADQVQPDTADYAADVARLAGSTIDNYEASERVNASRLPQQPAAARPPLDRRVLTDLIERLFHQADAAAEDDTASGVEVELTLEGLRDGLGEALGLLGVGISPPLQGRGSTSSDIAARLRREREREALQIADFVRFGVLPSPDLAPGTSYIVYDAVHGEQVGDIHYVTRTEAEIVGGGYETAWRTGTQVKGEEA